MKAVVIFFAFLFFLHFANPALAVNVVINEFVVDGSPEWVELYNASSSADYLKEYFIDDDESFNSDVGSSGKKSLVILNTSNPSYPYLDLSSWIFNNTGSDFVVLFDKDGNVVDSYSYEENPGNNISIGRSPDGSGDFFTLTAVTKGSANSSPVATPTPTPTPTPTTAPTSTPTPTNTPTPTPASASSPTNTPTPTKAPTPTSTINASASKPVTPPTQENVLQDSSSVLGESTGTKKGLDIAPPDNLISDAAKKPDNIFQGFLIVLGIVLIVISIMFTLRIIKKGEQVQNEEE